MVLTNAEKSARYRQRHPEKAKERVAEWRKANPEKAKAAVADWNTRFMYGKLKDPIKYLLQQAKKCARQKNRDFNLEYADIAEMLHPMVCKATGVKLTWEWNFPGNNLRAPSVDRIDSSKGYLADNIQIVCWAFNRMKGNAPNEVALQLLNEIRSRRL